MDSLTAIQYAMDFYYEITGLRSYFVQGVDEVDSAKEKNFFCKTLKLSSKALNHCDACTLENYTNALSKNEIQMYSCHASSYPKESSARSRWRIKTSGSTIWWKSIICQETF